MSKLSQEDKAIWRHVKQSIRPLRRLASEEESLPPLLLAPFYTPKRASEAVKPVSATLKPLAPFEKNIQYGLKRKSVDVQAKLDLHGLTQEAAHSRLQQFLHLAQAQGYRLVIIITGKGANGPSVLKQYVPLWLASPDLRMIVMGFQQAEPHHGGEGALYVRLRKQG